MILRRPKTADDARAGEWTRRDFGRAAAGVCANLWLAERRKIFAQEDTGETVRLEPQFPLTRHVPDAFAAFLAYDPEQDRDAPYFRSRIARQPRIAPFAPTQAQPRLSAMPRVASLTGCYRGLGYQPDDRYKKMRYGRPPKGGVAVSRVVGSQDILVSWSGPGLIPNPALTDAAHRNGALCLGTIFQPDHRMYDSSAVAAAKVAAKLVELAVYFGFDGYFVNFEMGTASQHAQVLRLMAEMQTGARGRGKLDFHLQFYDGSTDIEDLLPLRGSGDAGEPDANSAMLDQGWSGYSMMHGCCSGKPLEPAPVARYCREHGIDPFAAYFGLQLYPGPGYLGVAAPEVIHPNDSTPAYGSLQIYSWDDGLYTLAGYEVDTAGLPPSSRAERFYSLERHFFSGQSGNPACANAPTEEQRRQYAAIAGGTRRYSDYTRGSTRTTDQVRLPITYGVANFIAERSVIGSLPFVTRFNVGEGDAFFLEGAIASDRPWFHLGIQDVLPTWQWWTGPKTGAADNRAFEQTPLTVTYDKRCAFDGGTSLRIQGAVPPEGVALRLYKTKVRLTAPAAGMQVVWRSAAGTECTPEIGMIFEDAAETTVWMRLDAVEPVASANTGAGWTRTTLDLNPYRGRVLAGLLAGFSGTSAPGRCNADAWLGEVYLGGPPNARQGTAPADFRVEAHSMWTPGRSVEARLRWTMSAGASYYDLFAVWPETSKRQWIGRICGDCYYAEEVMPDGNGEVRFELVGVYRDAPLARSLPATAWLRCVQAG